MNQVWKCDFCSETSPDAVTMAKHEADCSFNPATKRCYSCAHRTDEGAPISGFWNGCSAGVSREEQEAVEDRKKPCDTWQPESIPVYPGVTQTYGAEIQEKNPS